MNRSVKVRAHEIFGKSSAHAGEHAAPRRVSRNTGGAIRYVTFKGERPVGPDAIMIAGERLERIASGEARGEIMPLLLLADDSPTLVDAYHQLGDLFVLRGSDGAAHGIALAVPALNGAFELKAVAVAPERQGQGVGQRMLARVLAELRSAGVRRVIVGTASCGIGQLAFYQKAGFRLWKIERNYFTRERGYPDGVTEHGIPLRDMVWMDQEI